MRIWYKIALALVLGIFIAALVFPFLYRDKFTGFVKSEINKRINGTLEFNSADLSLIKNFPCISLTLKEVKISGAEDFNMTDLIQAKAINLGFDLKKLLKSSFKEFQLIKVELIQPDVNLVTTKTGVFNFTDLIKSSVQDSNTANPFELLLEKINVESGSIRYVDSSARLYFRLTHLSHESKGQFKNSILKLDQRTSFDSLTYASKGMAFLKNVKGTWDGPIDWNGDSSMYSFKQSEIVLNALKIGLDGWFRQNPDSTSSMNFKFKTPENNLKSLISLIPGAFQSHFSELNAKGSFSTEGTIMGNSNEKSGQVPLINITSSIDNGSIKYNQLPYPIENIQLKLSIHSKDSFAKRYKIEIPVYSLEVEHEKISGNLTLNQGHNDVLIQGESKGRLALATINKALPIDNLQMSGNIDFNTQFDFTQSQVEHKEFGKMKLSGLLNGSMIKIKYPSILPFEADSVVSTLNPEITKVRFAKVHYGRSDLDGQLNLKNPLALAVGNTAKAEMNLDSRSTLLDLNEVMDQSNLSNTTNTQASAFTNESIIPKLNMIFQVKASATKYKDYAITNANVSGTYKNDSLAIQTGALNINQSNLTIDGKINHPYQWIDAGYTLHGYLNIKSALFNLDPWMSDSSATTGNIDDSAFIKNLPERTDLNIHTTLGQVNYGAFQIKNLTADARLSNQNLEIYNSSGSLYNGKVSMNGVYQESAALPGYNFKLDMSNLKIEDMFRSSKTFSTLVPVAAFLEGLFSTSIIINGKLNAALSPIWNEIDASGVLETFNGVLAKFKPLEEIANKIQIPILSKINWEKSKNWFEIEKGTMIIKPFEIKSGDITIQINGSHHLDQELNYDALFIIPRKVFDKYKVGIMTNTKLDWLKSQAANKGINLSSLDTFFIKANIKGNIKSPATTINWVEKPNGKSIQEQIKEDVTNQIKSKVDSAKNSAEDKINQKKDSIINVLKKEINLKKEQIDSIRNKIEDSLKKIAEKKSTELLDSLVKKNAGKILDSTVAGKLDTLVGGKAKEEIKKINDKLKDWNPFKKKPKSN